VQNVSAGRTYFVLEKDFVCEPCQGSQWFVLSLYLLHL
jgi:hypothetical protein